MNILTIGASNSAKSINRKLANWAANQIEEAQVNLIDINDYEMPIFSVERMQEGIPEKAHAFKALIASSDGIVISFAEYNGSYTSGFKNIFDWTSVLDKPIWMKKPVFLMATSDGERGAALVLGIAKTSFPYQGANVVGVFSLPLFHANFSENEGITNHDLLAEFQSELGKFTDALKSVLA